MKYTILLVADTGSNTPLRVTELAHAEADRAPVDSLFLKCLKEQNNHHLSFWVHPGPRVAPRPTAAERLRLHTKQYRAEVDALRLQVIAEREAQV